MGGVGAVKESNLFVSQEVTVFRADVKSSTAPRVRSVDLERLRRTKPALRLPGRNLTKADVLVYRSRGLEVAVKDYGGRPFLVRHTIGRFFIRREAAAHRAAAGTPGIPEFLGRLGPFALATRWVEARPLASLAGKRVEPQVFYRIGAILGALHERGIAIADLHHRDVLVAEDGSVFLVDLATAWLAKSGSGRIRRALFHRLRQADIVALARMRARFLGQDEQAAVAAVGRSAAAWHATGRRLRTVWDGLRGRPDALARGRLFAVFASIALLVAFARPTPLGVSVGFALAALGEALRFWAAGYLRKTAELVTSGPYRYTRNPLYLGRLLIFTGLSVMAGLPYGLNWLVLVAGWAIFFGYYLPRKERVEPARLRQLHGAAYEQYFRSVPALLPTFRPYAERAGVGWSSDRVLRNREHWMVLGLFAVTLFLLWRAHVTQV